MKLPEIEKEMAKIECPICSAKDFDIHFHCDLGYECCLTVAQCRHCGHEFEATELVQSHEHNPFGWWKSPLARMK